MTFSNPPNPIKYGKFHTFFFETFPYSNVQLKNNCKFTFTELSSALEKSICLWYAKSCCVMLVGNHWLKSTARFFWKNSCPRLSFCGMPIPQQKKKISHGVTAVHRNDQLIRVVNCESIQDRTIFKVKLYSRE